MRSLGGVGLGLALMSAAAFGTAGALAASLIDSGWTPAAAVTARVTIAALVLTVPALLHLRGRHAQLRRNQLRRTSGSLLVYGLLAVAGAQLCFFTAISHLSVGVALLLEYSAALLVVGWLWLRHGQRPRRLTAVGGLVALTGLALVLNLTGDQQVNLTGALWGLGAAGGLAVYFVISAGDSDALPPVVMAWGGLAVGGAVLLAAGALGVLEMRAPRVDVTLLDVELSWLVPLLSLALVAAAFAYIAGIAAARSLGARLASFVGLTEVLFAVAFAWLLLGQVPLPIQLAGGLLVLAGIALVRYDELRGPSTKPAPAPVRAT